jgi:beta-N-acetylhexosaminidase
MVGFAPEEEEILLGMVSEGRIGGIILFSRNAEEALQAKETCSLIRDASELAPLGHPPVIAVDQEGGRVCRIKRGVALFPAPGVLASLRRPVITRRVAWWTARELLYLGITANLAPVSDVPCKERVPAVLEDRTFGTDPKTVLRHVTAWIRGSQAAGLWACCKHFPGHGFVQEDSHTSLPRDPSPMDTLRSVHLVPFAGGIDAGVGIMMVGHVAYMALDDGVPASLSAVCMQGLLRRELGFDGLILTDDLEMAAVGDTMEAVIKSLASGADMALVGRNLGGNLPLEDLESELKWAFSRGLLPGWRVVASLGRIEGLWKRFKGPLAGGLGTAPPSVGGRCLSMVLSRLINSIEQERSGKCTQ